MQTAHRHVLALEQLSAAPMAKSWSESACHHQEQVSTNANHSVGTRLTQSLLIRPFAGSLQMPGGHLEYGEDILNCAEREVLEETGLRVRGVKIVTVTNSVFEPEHLHYVTVITYCEVLEPDAEPRVSQTAPPPLLVSRVASSGWLI